MSKFFNTCPPTLLLLIICLAAGLITYMSNYSRGVYTNGYTIHVYSGGNELHTYYSTERPLVEQNTATFTDALTHQRRIISGTLEITQNAKKGDN